MELTPKQYEKVKDLVAPPARQCKDEQLDFLNALLYVAESGCKWRKLPRQFGSWHTIYTRMNRWAKKGIMDQVFAEL